MADAFDIGVHKFEAASLRFASGALVLEIGRVLLHELATKAGVQGSPGQLQALTAHSAELSGTTLRGPAIAPRPGSGGPWQLAPLGAAQGTIRAAIVDAHLLFDAEVTVPIQGGQIDFDDATVEHVGPDSRMGISPDGLYVDAPNGRTYVLQFTSVPAAGVDFERRAALFTRMVSDRGVVRLQEFLEGMLSQPAHAPAADLTGASRLLLDRTSLSGELQPGDGPIAVPGLQGELAGGAEGRNAMRIHSDALARGLTVEIPTLRMRNVVLHAKNAQLHCDEITGAITLRLFVEERQWRFALEIAEIQLTGLKTGLNSPSRSA